MLTEVTVVVPAHDEQELLPACLAALNRAVREVPQVRVRIVVVLDACTDDTGRIATAAGVDVVAVDRRNVGAARAAGFEHALASPGCPVRRRWLATTDADSVVPPAWLRSQLAHAEHADVVAGTVQVDDWSGRPSWLPGLYRDRYASGGEHVHGANLGLLATAYRAVGGFRPVECAEDVQLVATLRQHGYRVAYALDTPVRTSARRLSRSFGGFATHLDDLEATVLSRGHARTSG